MNNNSDPYRPYVSCSGLLHSKRNLPVLLLLCLVVIPYSDLLRAQQPDSIQTRIERDIEWAVEEFDSEEADLNMEELLELLQSLAANPLNINRAELDELLQVPGLNFHIAQNIVQYRNSQAPFQTLDNLLNVHGIDQATLERIRPYLTVGTGQFRRQDLYLNPRYWTENGRFEGLSRVQRVLEKQYGYQRPDTLGGFVGSPVNYYQRFRYTSNHLSVNLTQEKDPGEPLAHPGDFDYNSWHVALKENGRLNHLIIGDFSAAFGQGLLLWSGGAFGKGSEVIRTASKSDRGIRPYTSAQEMNGFRGIAATYGRRLQVTGFYSNRRRTASEIDNTYVRFPSGSGYHRTLTERNRRLNLGQETAAGRVRLQVPHGFLGISAVYNRFDRPVERGTLPWQIHNFEGQNLLGYSADYRLLAGPVLLFGEAAFSDNRGYGVLSGAEFKLGENTEAVTLYRYYDPALQTIFGAGFGEQSGDPGNEEGFYLGLRHSFGSKIRASAYMDQFRFPAARFQLRQPTSGYNWLGLIEYNPNRDLRLYTLFRYKQKEQEYTGQDEMGREIRLLDDHKRSGARFQAEYHASPSVRLRTRFDMVRARSPGANPGWGYLVFQDIQLYPYQQLRVDARVTIFDTDGFNSRVYQFETDLLYVLSNTMLFDRGQRMYIVLKYRASGRLEFWVKAATTRYDNRNKISSGNQRIDGNRRSDIGFQARIRL